MTTQTLAIDPDVRPGTATSTGVEPATAEVQTPQHDVPHPGQWRLQRIELVHWGTFHGHHVVDVARRGFLLTGHSGSGKSSLVDAVTAVLTPPGRIRFNAAAADAGSRRADRNVAGYVRGAWRRQTDETTGEVVSEYLREGATWSGIALQFDSGTDAPPVTLVKLFHLRAGENTKPSELHILTTGPLPLLDLQPYARDGLATRQIKAAWPAAFVTDRHSSFAARFCRVLGIGGDNALALLHKTQSAKNLGSLDDLFRGFMLDEPSTFDLADVAVDQFTELSAAHGSVVTAREQVAHLGPLRRLSAAFDDANDDVGRVTSLLASLPAFTERWQLDLARHERDRLLHELAVAQEAVAEARARSLEAEDAVRAAELLVARHGGQALAERRTAVEHAAETLARAVRERDLLAQRLREVGVVFPESFAEFEELRLVAQTERERGDADDARERDRVHGLFSARADASRRVDDLDRELTALKRVRSNMPAALLEARQTVCRATGLSSDVLPFAGELLQVRAEHRGWAGPIERVLRPLATVLLVPAIHRDAVVHAVDIHHLRARVVLEVVPAQADRARLVGSPGSLVHRVEVKAGPMRPWLESVLSRQYDYECVENDSGLHGLERAVTRAGQVKRGATRLEKDDRFPVDDRSRWVLGFGNEEKVEHLVAQRREADAEVRRLDTEIARAERAHRVRQDRVSALRGLSERTWAELDVAGARQAHERAERALAELRAASTDLRAAEVVLARARQEAGPAAAAVEAAMKEHASLDGQRANVEKVVADLESRAPEEVPPERRADLEQRFHRVQRTVRYDGVDKLARVVDRGLQDEREQARSAAAEAHQGIVEIQAEFRRRWPALAGDLTTAVDDRGGYLAVLDRLEGDRLPEFEERFFSLMQSQSQRNIGQLASLIRRAPGEIREKIQPINASLLRSPFDHGRYLQIKVDEHRATAVQEFLADLRTVSAGSWAEEERDAAEQRFAVMDRVMRRLASSQAGDRTWRALCLDTRRHVRFTGVEVDDDGVQVNIHDSSAGLSGGQRQKLVVFCLAAALRYQLTADGQDVPTFGTVVLDEAFDKADAAFTRMAMDVFVEFGFHMVLATPLKLLQTLEEYVGGIGLVTCRDFKASSLGLVTVGDAGAGGEAAAGGEAGIGGAVGGGGDAGAATRGQALLTRTSTDGPEAGIGGSS